MLVGHDSYLPSSTHAIIVNRQCRFWFCCVFNNRFFCRLIIECFLGNLANSARARASALKRRQQRDERRTHGKADDEPHGAAERCHDEDGAQCDGIRIARGPLGLWRQCGDECRRVANTIDQL